MTFLHFNLATRVTPFLCFASCQQRQRHDAITYSCGVGWCRRSGGVGVRLHSLPARAAAAAVRRIHGNHAPGLLSGQHHRVLERHARPRRRHDPQLMHARPRAERGSLLPRLQGSLPARLCAFVCTRPPNTAVIAPCRQATTVSAPCAGKSALRAGWFVAGAATVAATGYGATDLCGCGFRGRTRAHCVARTAPSPPSPRNRTAAAPAH